MITIPEAVENIVRSSPTLAEGLSRGILNLSAVARAIHGDVERAAMKEIQQGAVIMALNRLSRRTRDLEPDQRTFIGSSPGLLVRSNLMEFTFAISESLVAAQKTLLDRIGGRRELFITITRGIFETTIIASRESAPLIDEIFRKERELARMEGLSSLTVRLPPGTATTPGVYAFLLRSLAWEGINVVEVVSTLNELTIILSDGEIDRAFSVIKAAVQA